MFLILMLQYGMSVLVQRPLEVARQLVHVQLVGRHQLLALLVQALDLRVPVAHQLLVGVDHLHDLRLEA